MITDAAGGCPGCAARRPLSTQPQPDRNGNLRANYAVGCPPTPVPPGDGSNGISDTYLYLGYGGRFGVIWGD